MMEGGHGPTKLLHVLTVTIYVLETIACVTFVGIQNVQAIVVYTVGSCIVPNTMPVVVPGGVMVHIVYSVSGLMV